MTSHPKAVEQHLEEFEYLDDRLSDAIAELVDDENLELPDDIHRGFEEIERAMRRLRYWLKDQLQIALCD